MKSDVILNKAGIIERCVSRINEEYFNDPSNLVNITKQESIILNIQRACEVCIDMAMHIVAQKKLGIPQNSRDAIDFLQANGVIDEGLSMRVKAMIGFRNIAVHDYQTVNLAIVQRIIEEHLVDFSTFKSAILNLVD